MANLNTTRHLAVPNKHYVAAHVQQGRSLVDSDWNESVQLEAEDLRRTLADLMCAHGSSNAGFSVTDVVRDVTLILPDGDTYTTYDFTLRAGSLYVGGMRFQIDEPNETFLGQVDWLQIGHDQDNLPPPPLNVDLLVPEVNPEAATPAQYHLVYLEAWEQSVTAVEDAELRERALGGPDTSTRVRRMRQIHVAPNIGVGDPPDAFEQLQANLEATGTGVFNSGTLEFESAARLTVTPITETGEQPCGPTPPSGYIGHEDQAIRVELRGASSLVWGFGNAAPLYRVQIGVGDTTLTLLNRPRDAQLQPKTGQIIELIPWGSDLPNDEKVAARTGELIRVARGYDPATGELLLHHPPSTVFVSWQTQPQGEYDEPDTTPPAYAYMRLWSRGGDIDSDVLIDAPEGTIVPLGKTGLQVQLSGAGQSGDHWIIAARRATPERVVPWQLLTDDAPHGPHRYYAPLALISWEAPLHYMTAAQKDALGQVEVKAVPIDLQADIWAVWGPVRARVMDARRRLQRLCSGCGTILVGDGDVSFGMVDSLELALGLLPPDGGEIHLLPGLHVGEVKLDSVKNITITGCSLESQLVNDIVVGENGTLSNQGKPLIELVNCENIVLKDFVVRATSAVGIKLSEPSTPSRDVRIEGVRFHMDGSYTDPGLFALSQAAILGLGGDRITIDGCHVEISDTLNYVPAIVLGGTELRVRGNHVRADLLGTSQSMGGVQILSFSQDVEITDNVIRGGWGHGISLGHLLNLATPVNPALTLDAETSWSKLDRSLGDAISNLRGYAPGAESATSLVDELWTPGGPLIGVRIRDNRIFDKGLSGISTGGFVNTAASGDIFIVAVDVEIHRNEIVGNMQIDGEDLDLDSFEEFDVCVGGVGLAAVINLLVHENRIINNGVDYDTPIVGVGVVSGQGVVIHDNVIADNGIAHATADTEVAHKGLRGGAAFGAVVGTRGYTFKDGIPGVTVAVPSFVLNSNNVALTVRKNEIGHRLGKALWVRSGFGPIIVNQNSLHGLGDPVTSHSIPKSELGYGSVALPSPVLPSQGACVEIRNYASSPLVDYGAGVIPTLSFGDTESLAFEGGPLEFDANEVSLDWYWEDGYACSVLLSSLDTVKVTNNVMSVNMNGTYEPGGLEPEEDTFLADVTMPLAGMSYLLVNCWAGATSTVQASGNRFEERRYDCVFSYLGAHAAAFDDSGVLADLTKTSHASMTMMNVGTHCMVPPFVDAGETLPVVNTDNVTVREVVANCAVTARIDIGATQRVLINI